MASSGGLRAIVDVRPGERRLAALMFSYFFLVITSFWILKPIKKTLFLSYYANEPLMLLGRTLDGPGAEQLAKVINMVVAAVAAVAFSTLARSLRREQLTTVFSLFVIACLALFGLTMGAPGEGTVWGFYLFGDLFNTLMVATFFAFLNDSVDPDMAKRVFGVVGLGGVLGGVVGSSVVATFIGSLSRSEWLAAVAGLCVAIIAIAWDAGRQVRAHPPVEATPTSAEEPAPAGNPAVAGARLVFRSSYLLAIVAVVGLYEVVSTIVDYQFTSTIVHFVEDDAARSQHFASVFAFTNWVSMFVQLLLTSFVMRRFGLAVALAILPLSILAVSTGFMLLPGLWIGSALNTADNGLSYSLNQSAKEALYVPTTREEKYQAKAFIDMFVQRFAKAVAVGVNLTVSALVPSFAGIRWLTLILIPVLLVWSYAAVFAGRRFAEVTGEADETR